MTHSKGYGKQSRSVKVHMYHHYDIDELYVMCICTRILDIVLYTSRPPCTIYMIEAILDVLGY